MLKKNLHPNLFFTNIYYNKNLVLKLWTIKKELNIDFYFQTTQMNNSSIKLQNKNNISINKYGFTVKKSLIFTKADLDILYFKK